MTPKEQNLKEAWKLHSMNSDRRAGFSSAPQFCLLSLAKYWFSLAVWSQWSDTGTDSIGRLHWKSEWIVGWNEVKQLFQQLDELNINVNLLLYSCIRQFWNGTHINILYVVIPPQSTSRKIFLINTENTLRCFSKWSSMCSEASIWLYFLSSSQKANKHKYIYLTEFQTMITLWIKKTHKPLFIWICPLSFSLSLSSLHVSLFYPPTAPPSL